MSGAALQFDAVAGPPRVGAVADRLDSKLFGSLFQTVDVDRRLTVLEIGSALPETVDFFAQFKCRLLFVDLFSEPFVHDQADLSETELRHCFEERFRFPADTRLDLCLFWDFLSYLDDPALRAFNSALRPWLHRGSRAHGFGAHPLGIRLANVRYGVRDYDFVIDLTQRIGEAFTFQDLDTAEIDFLGVRVPVVTPRTLFSLAFFSA